MILIYASHNRTVGDVDHCISQLFYFVVKMIRQYPIQSNNDYSSLISLILPVTWGVGGWGALEERNFRHSWLYKTDINVFDHSSSLFV